MSSDHRESYDVMAYFYPQLAADRDHFGKQLRLLDEILPAAQIRQQHRILDAACGTGDVLAGLRERGFSRLEGIDASLGMLSAARQQHGLLNVGLHEVDWAALGQWFELHGRFDCVFFLGHALPHAEVSDLPGILDAVRKGLEPGGVLLFDVRRWVPAEDGGLVQPGRRFGVTVPLPSSVVYGERWDVYETCTYEGGRQIIRYEACTAGGRGVNWELSYATFQAEGAAAWARSAGFGLVEVQEERLYWNYRVVVARVASFG